MPTNPNMVAIQTVTVGAGGAASIDFTNIPQTYTDLVVKYSCRLTSSADATLKIIFNSNTANYSNRVLYGNGSAAASFSNTPGYAYGGIITNTADTASTFSNGEILIPNYTSSNNKSLSLDAVSENNGTQAYQFLSASLWSNSAAITSISLDPINDNLAQYSTATLYGVTSAGYGAKATGGIITQDANYYYHTFLASGTFTPTQSLSCDLLVVAGGGGGGKNYGGGGGAGGLVYATAQSVTATNYTVTIGAGGAGQTATWTPLAQNGSNSSFSSTSATGGGYGGGYNGSAYVGGGTGGSGGGGSYNSNGAAGTSGQGNAGGNGGTVTGGETGGGGGAGAVGSNGASGIAGAGGAGTNTYATWHTVTGTGISGYIAGGGGGGAGNGAKGTGGTGGGGDGATNGGVGVAVAGTAGTANTGGGGGGGSWYSGNGASGGSGVVIVRYAK